MTTVPVPATYRAMQIDGRGGVELVERDTPLPSDEEVLIQVEVCGICGADIADIARADAAKRPPRVPGHEVIGRIAALGARAGDRWKLGQRVGVGRLGGHCNQCAQCRQGRFQLCQNQPIVGSTRDGGYAEVMLARATGLVAIPSELGAAEAAPVLCAGLATFNALRKCGAEAGDIVVVLGIGGLGHMAVQYARRMGFRVVAIGRGRDIEQDVRRLGAHDYLDNQQDDPVAWLKERGGAQAIVTTIDDASTVGALLPALAPGGRMMLLNPGKKPLEIPASLLVGGQRSIVGSMTGTPHDSERALAFSVLVDARPQVEVLPLERANAALEGLRSGVVRFRMVLSMAPLS